MSYYIKLVVAWISIITIAFHTGNINSFLFFTALMILFVSYLDTNRLATFLFLLPSIPPISVTIGGIGFFNYIVDLNNQRLLVIFLIIPILYKQIYSQKNSHIKSKFLAPEILFLLYISFILILQLRLGITTFIRQFISLAFDYALPFFAFSRCLNSYRDIRLCLFTFVLSAGVLSIIGIYEWVHLKLLFANLFELWMNEVFAPFDRAGMLRASATSTLPVVFGFTIMVALGFSFAIFQVDTSRIFSFLVIVILLGGLWSSLSKGAWLGAAIIFIVYISLSKFAIFKLFLLGLVSTCVYLILTFTDIGQNIIALIPFIGSADTGSFIYRQQLLEASSSLILKNPLFGSFDYIHAPELQKLLQGQNIIDIVNSYIQITLTYGLIGLLLFVASFMSIGFKLYFAAISLPYFAEDNRRVGYALLATFFGIHWTIGTLSFISFVPFIYWSFAGLCVAYIRISYSHIDNTETKLSQT